eukprot:5369801-Ditylum_brightwellii.AAC.1
MEISYTVPPDGTEAKQLYKSENQYFYNVLQNCVKGGQALIYIRKYELTLDGREAFCQMMDFYEMEENLTLIQTDCNMEHSKIKLNQKYKGGPLKFFLAFQNAHLDLENCTGKTVRDEEKIGALNCELSAVLLGSAEIAR